MIVRSKEKMRFHKVKDHQYYVTTLLDIVLRILRNAEIIATRRKMD